MKVLVGWFFISSFLFSYAQKPDLKQKPMIQELIAAKDSLPQYPREKQSSYVAHVSGLTPYEIYFDDILVSESQQSGNNETIDLNPYILKNGTYTLKVRFLPTEDSKDGLLRPIDVQPTNPDVKWDIYFIKLQEDPNEPLGYSGTIDYRNTRLSVSTPPGPVPYWEQEFKVEVKDLPYELKGWSDGEDLSQLDQKELEKEVVAFYNKLRNLLNEGKIAEYMQLGKIKTWETSISKYNTPEEFEEDYKENFESLRKYVGNMLPIENYKMVIYGNDKLVALERIDKEFEKWNALICKTEDSYWYLGSYLYRPKGSKDFVIIRK